MPALDHDNEEDRHLLQVSPQTLVVRHQPVIRQVVRHFMRRGAFTLHDEDDLVQELSVKLLEKTPKMQAEFKGRATVRTYLAAVIRNICLDTMRKDRHAIRTEPFVECAVDAAEDPYARALIEEEKARFQAILLQYAASRPRVILCLKLRFRIALTPSDLRNIDPQCTDEDIREFLAAFPDPYERLTDQEIYKRITPLLNRIEGKATTIDAFRKWSHNRLTEIISLLNGTPPTGKHTEETLGLLLEEVFSPDRRR
jgi:RNA polymerase sigma factor (sigma-70 family)